MSPDNHYIGVDVGTGSARACVIDSAGEIKALAERKIRLWQPQPGYYEQSTVDIWRSICQCVRAAVADSNVSVPSIKGIGFDATCSLAVFARDTDEPMCVTPPGLAHDASSPSSSPVAISGPEGHNKAAHADGDDSEVIRNIILWLDHRPETETRLINATRHPVLVYVGGTMSIEMEMPKVLWLKRNMPPDIWDRCKFYDLADALTHLATGGGAQESRSFCSTVCKQAYVPVPVPVPASFGVGTDGCVKGWQPDFYEAIGLGEMVGESFERIGGVDGVNGRWLSAGEPVGGLCDKSAAQLGLTAGIAVGSGVIDAYAGWIGTVGAKVDLPGWDQARGESLALNRLVAVAGTSTCHLAMSRDAIFVPGVWGPYNNAVLQGFWMAEGGQSATGALLNYILETHPAYKTALAKAEEKRCINIYDYLNGHLESMKQQKGTPSLTHLGKEIFFYGDLWGNRSPVADPNMCGSLVGMTSDTSVDNLALMYYVTMEFIALQTRQIVLTMNKAGHQIGSIFICGSQCRNPLLVSMVATACGMPVVVPEYASVAVVHGAAMLGVKAANPKERLWNIMERMTRPGKIVWPEEDAKVVKLLMAKYEIFLLQMDAQREYRKRVEAALES